MTPIDFQNDDRFSIAPPWIVERLNGVPFFSVGEDDSQSYHALILLTGGQKIGVPVYRRRWIKLGKRDLQAVTAVFQVLRQVKTDACGNNGHQLQAEKGAEMSNDENDYRTTETQANKCDLLAINAATCQDEKYVLLTIRMDPNSFKVTEILFPLSQAQERLQLDLADLLERSPVFNEAK